MRVDIPVGLQLLCGTVSYAAVKEDCTSGLVIEVFDDVDKVGADVAFYAVLKRFQRSTLGELTVNQRPRDPEWIHMGNLSKLSCENRAGRLCPFQDSLAKLRVEEL